MVGKQKSSIILSFDIEDVRSQVKNGHLYQPRVVENTTQYLDFLNKVHGKATFFVVGDVALEYPQLMKDIEAEGHSIGLHSQSHIPIDRMSPEEFKRDIAKNIESIRRSGVSLVDGFRAPVFSLTSKSTWVYPILEQVGITFSSSILPARNPLYGWPHFGCKPRMVGKIKEYPISIYPQPFPSVPLGGTYFRVLPTTIIKWGIKHLLRNNFPAQLYFHPYDIDSQQEWFMHAGINNNKFFNYLMYYGRKSVIKKLSCLSTVYRFTDYKQEYMSNNFKADLSYGELLSV